MNGYLSNPAQEVKCRRVVCADGKESGLKLVELGNGVIELDLLESNALDIGALRYRGKNVSFISKNGFCGGLCGGAGGFSSSFSGGMLYTCGLESLGARQGFAMHGSLHGVPCNIVNTRTFSGGAEVTAKIHFTELFGVNFCITRKITLENNGVCVCDELENLGFEDENYCMLYHVNFGYPFLDGEAYMQFDSEYTGARTPFAEVGLKDAKRMGEPRADIEEAVYFHRLSTPRVEVVSPSAGLKAEITYSGDTLPCLVEWKSLKSGDYALGIEPATCFLDGGFEYKRIKAGERIENFVKLRFEEL